MDRPWGLGEKGTTQKEASSSRLLCLFLRGLKGWSQSLQSGSFPRINENPHQVVEGAPRPWLLGIITGILCHPRPSTQKSRRSLFLKLG